MEQLPIEELSEEKVEVTEDVAEETVVPAENEAEASKDVLIKEGDLVRIWCPKCGRRLRVAYGKTAYMCPGCTTLIQTKKTAKMFVEV
ncbi:MAG: hypothetical protein IJX87_05340 [Clostridia bacterium]|nr:hypothetical protein [Clostridia bacterium]